MKENTCVIYDKDEKYAERLMGAFNEKGDAPFGVQMFTKEKELINYLDGNSPEVLMVSEESFTYEIGKKHDGKLMILCDEDKDDEKMTEEFGSNAESIYKYQSSERIVKSVIGSTRVNACIIGIYSLYDFKGKTVFGLEYAYGLSETDKVLYINLEEFSALTPVLQTNENMTLSDAFYYYKQFNSYNPKINRTISRIGNMDYIMPVRCAEDIAYLTSGEILEFIRDISCQCQYEYVVVDMGNAVRQPWKLMRGCSKVFMPIEKSVVSDVRVGQFEVYCMEKGEQTLLSKIKKVEIKNVVVDELILDDSYREIIGRGKMGECVRELIYG